MNFTSMLYIKVDLFAFCLAEVKHLLGKLFFSHYKAFCRLAKINVFESSYLYVKSHYKVSRILEKCLITF